MPAPWPHPILSTYRLQLRGRPGEPFTFADAEALLDYLDSLGVTHLYLSPILTAVPGSTHGYDVTDPTVVAAELGGPEGLARLGAAARGRGMGLVVDIVPNHGGVDPIAHAPWWWDVLRHGRESTYAHFFDIDWSADPDGRIALPILGSDEDAKGLAVDGDVLRLGDLAFPIAPGTADDGAPGDVVHDRQRYRLVDWRSGICGYRRFIAVTALAAIRQEDPAVFERSHTEIARWFAEGLADGVRVDHPDGLADPTGYLLRLRQLLGPEAWIVIEKILAPGEALDPALPVDGTSGYDVLREIGGVFVDPAGADELSALVESAGFDTRMLPELLHRLKIRATTHDLGSDLDRLCRTIEEAVGHPHPALRDAVPELLTEIGVYRCDYPAQAQALPAAIARTAVRRPDLTGVLEVLAAGLADCPGAAARLHQLGAAMTAKAIEDCYFYRDARLVSLNEVGGDPQRFGVSTAEFHHAAATRANLWPHTMTTLSTHDTKRGEDVRARIGVLSQVPQLWAAATARWEQTAPSPDRLTGLFLWQNIFGVWPPDGVVTGRLRTRLHAYAEKSIREAGVHTCWTDPDHGFEQAVHAWLDAVLDGPAAAGLTDLLTRLHPHACSDALGQKLLALTVPGIPDVYQGTEVWEDSLVDPDNRRPVDFEVLRTELARGRHPKIRVVAAALHARRDRPETFRAGRYRPVLGRGAAAEHLVAFRRGDDVLVAVCRWTVRLAETGWGDTVVDLPRGTWIDRLTGRRYREMIAAAELFADLPVSLLERADE